MTPDEHGPADLAAYWLAVYGPEALLVVMGLALGAWAVWA